MCRVPWAIPAAIDLLKKWLAPYYLNFAQGASLGIHATFKTSQYTCAGMMPTVLLDEIRFLTGSPNLEINKVFSCSCSALVILR